MMTFCARRDHHSVSGAILMLKNLEAMIMCMDGPRLIVKRVAMTFIIFQIRTARSVDHENPVGSSMLGLFI